MAAYLRVNVCVCICVRVCVGSVQHAYIVLLQRLVCIHPQLFLSQRLVALVLQRSDCVVKSSLHL
jgi:hypothetical protein